MLAATCRAAVLAPELPVTPIFIAVAKVNPAAVRAGGGFLVKMSGRLFRRAGRRDPVPLGRLDVVRHRRSGVAEDLLRARQRIRGGESFFLGRDEWTLKKKQRNIAADPPRFTVSMHGNRMEAVVGDRPVDADELASYLRSRASAWNGEDVRLLVCETGRERDGFAQQLADRLGVTVRAPNELVWISREGMVQTATRGMPNEFGNFTPGVPGDWIDFTPRS